MDSLSLPTRAESERRHWNELFRRWDKPEASFELRNPSDHQSFFNSLILEQNMSRILSVGGGIDRRAVYLAGKGIDVVMVDVSDVACEKTAALGRQQGVKASRLQIVCSCFEETSFLSEFDLVLAEDSLHHLDFTRAIKKIHAALRPKGRLLASEPSCFSPLVEWVHRHLPFHPEFDQTEHEIQIGHSELEQIRKTFESVECHYFQMLHRPTVAHFLRHWNLPEVRHWLQRADARLLQYPSVLHQFAHLVVVDAVK